MVKGNIPIELHIAPPLEKCRSGATSTPMQGDEDILLTVTLGEGAAGLRLDRALAEASGSRR